MPKESRTTIINTAINIFARNGYEGFSMRTLSVETGLGLSSIYHFFKDKDELLKEIFDLLGNKLGIERAQLPARKAASDALKDRIIFQFSHIEEVVFVLKYYLHFRPQYEKHPDGYLPAKAYLHIDEVLEQGIKTGEFTIPKNKLTEESKVVAHAINGFLLEYFPHQPKGKELTKLVNSIHRFLIRSLTNPKEV